MGLLLNAFFRQPFLVKGYKYVSKLMMKTNIEYFGRIKNNKTQFLASPAANC